MREIVTLQLGHLSNYTATHFWNAQEAYFTYSQDQESAVDHDVHWRPGIAADGSDTFLPRTVIYDLKGGFGSLRKINALYEDESAAVQPDVPSSSSVWPGKSVLHRQQPLEVSAYQLSLDDGRQPERLSKSSVRYWSDFSRVYYHPKSLVQLYDFELNSSIRPFERYPMGVELFQTLDKEFDIVDRDFRPFVEECDMMQGIQALATLDDAWGGFAAKYLDELRDEYPKSCIWLWGLQSPLVDVTREKRQLRLTNTAQTIAEVRSSASMVVPLMMPEHGVPSNTCVDPTSPWHVSAAFATAIETANLGSRLTDKAMPRAPSMWDMAEGLNTGGNQTLAGLRLGVGSVAGTLDDDDDGVDLFSFGRLASSTGKQTKRGRLFGEVNMLRGSQPDQANVAEDDTRQPARRLVGDPVTQKFNSSLKFPILDSFPHIYSESKDQPEVAVQTILSTTKSVGIHVKALKAQTIRSVSVDERETLSNELAEIADAYQDDWSSGSDEDDD
ncbi:unnamed protein product [Clonostachys rosea]|uniref:Protein DML1 n=1 Tax=Bionectria ochroleuca TaxID=29856 RepID=A0ABY6TP40_BIOOC|nr:unnamed protein product [Clonostachys rosea]